MKTYQISNTASGHNFGTYSGETALHAIAAMHRDAGYAAEVVNGELVTDAPGGADPNVVAVAAKTYQIQVRGNFGGTSGGWRPAITGTLNRTGRGDAEASTFAGEIPEDVTDMVCNELADDAEDNWRVVEV